MIKNYLRYAVAAAFLLASGMGNFAFAEFEEAERIDPTDPTKRNDTIATAQSLTIDSSGEVVVRGTIGVNTKAPIEIADVDYYSFRAGPGSIVTIDIDEGIKTPPPDCGINPRPECNERSLDSVIAIFGPGPNFPFIHQMDDPKTGDDGSVNAPPRIGGTFDARLDNVKLDSGIYVVGVTGARRRWDGGVLTGFIPGSLSNGKYKLIIKGVAPAVMQVRIDIKPGSNSLKPPINPKSRGNIPVALLSSKDPKDPSKDFDALKADRDSIKFGPPDKTGTIGRCGKGGEDVNGDTLPDLVCHFDTQAAKFDESDEEGVITGMINGMPFEGRGSLKVFPVKRAD